MNVLKQYRYDSPQIWKNSLRILQQMPCFCARYLLNFHFIRQICFVFSATPFFRGLVKS